MDAEFILALSALIVGVMGAGTAIATNKSAASRVEVEGLKSAITVLQNTVSELQEENARLRKRIEELEKENAELRAGHPWPG